MCSCGHRGTVWGVWLVDVQVLNALNYSTTRTKWEDLGVMAIMVVVYRAAFFFMLKLREALSK